jgi:hypothetical protein
LAQTIESPSPLAGVRRRQVVGPPAGDQHRIDRPGGFFVLMFMVVVAQKSAVGDEAVIDLAAVHDDGCRLVPQHQRSGDSAGRVKHEQRERAH